MRTIVQQSGHALQKQYTNRKYEHSKIVYRRENERTMRFNNNIYWPVYEFALVKYNGNSIFFFAMRLVFYSLCSQTSSCQYKNYSNSFGFRTFQFENLKFSIS